MRYKRATETTQVFLENQPLPSHGKSYTVVSHKEVIENTKKLLEDSGFTIRREHECPSSTGRVSYLSFTKH